ncbi:MAG: AAA family ATPase [Coriobacteriia bacterium]|nr:AAA family ATPase [Coriobacteriia bacterium]
MERLFYQELQEWKASKLSKPLLVQGARQVGKTYIIDSFCKTEFKQYRQINLFEEPLLKQVYESELSADSKFEQLQMLAGIKLDDPQTVLFIDEVQESEEFISSLKYLHEKHPEMNIICAGSLLGVKLKRFKSTFPVGKVTIRNMYPMSFSEFLMAVGKTELISHIWKCYQGDEKMLPALHEELLHTLRTYLCVGGMPEAAQQYLDIAGELLEFDSSFFDDLKASYINDMNKYVRNQSEAIKIGRIFNSIPLQQANNSHKFQYSKILSGARAAHYETALDWLMAADLAYKVDNITLPEKPIRYYIDSDVFKLFLNDVGMLTHSLGIDYSDIILDRLGQFKGLLAESFVACELRSAGYALCYWRSENNAEVDFLIEGEDGVIPVEVKSGDNVQSKSLNSYRRKYDPPFSIRLSTKNFGFTEGIKSVPLYAAFCIAGTVLHSAAEPSLVRTPERA